ncbi:sensor histidine kinase [Lysinibacillus sp. 2017]|uniref:sensor histidine kinase n=1 Tax=unclassified Lysinibacillus TaxID=2636778 RepID=UPI000D52789B|nr:MULTISPECIES: sensor histidine kinase [unclassified Lysinibacillus]AWE08653.1 sensor histidine kinase [Lysinibacillus sp. 2017]TGN35074.1 HAMP domain-containing histidine kinase [Lysinibacillus sp. S2017]
MAIKLFIKEHVSYIIFQIVLTVFLIALFWLDGFRDMDTASYAIVISVLLITSFLVVRYMLRRRYLAKIIELPTTMEDALQKNAKTSEYATTERYLNQLYKLYQHEVQSLYATQSRQYKFMNQWVHQMKTPVSVLELLLQQEEQLDKKSVQEEVERLKRGLEMVLMNARLENFADDMQIVKVPLKSVVTATVNENKRLFITNRVFPDVQIDDDLIVMSDSKWLTFLIEQFITNAVKYTFEPNKKIYISTKIIDHRIHLTIRDEGIGIPKSDLSRVTKAFFTGENGRKTGESTGMGLYIAKEICNQLGHQLVVTSEVGHGTKIEVIFQS